MNIYPAIDIKSGAFVRLYQGRYDEVTVYGDNPVSLAETFRNQGAKWLHIVDLDGARDGKQSNLASITAIAKQTKINVQSGGGIRTKKQIASLLAQGVRRVVLGSIAVAEPELVSTWINEFGSDQITVALDVRLGSDSLPMLASNGWQVETNQSLWHILDAYQNSALRHVLCTDISRDGTLQGPNISLYRECASRYPSLQFQASGGVSQLTDLAELANIPVAGVVIGKALYESNFTLPDAISEVSSC